MLTLTFLRVKFCLLKTNYKITKGGGVVILIGFNNNESFKVGHGDKHIRGGCKEHDEKMECSAVDAACSTVFCIRLQWGHCANRS
jgi:hypothetical protein